MATESNGSGARRRGVRVVVTGMGAVTPIGAALPAVWRAACSGRSGVRRIESFDASGLDVRIAAEVRNVPGHAAPQRRRTRLDRKERFAFAAAEEALAMAGLQRGDVRLAAAALVFGSEVSRPVLSTGPERGVEQPARPAHRATHRLAGHLGIEGPVLTFSMACASSAVAVAGALDLIRDGAVELAVAGGSDSQIDPLGIALFGALGVLSARNDDPSRASRPFDVARDGFVMGEGAGIIVLESLEHARRRGAKVLAELSGFGISSNAYRITDSPLDGRGPDAAMAAALEDAGLRPRDVQYINAHGTGTFGNDVSEASAIRKVFGRHARGVAVSSTKSMMGHLIAAAGAVELILTIQAVRSGQAPPTINLEKPDPQCGLRHVVRRAAAIPMHAALSNSFAFGGTNVSLAVTRAPA